MRYLDTFERKVVFPCMRVIAIVAIIGLLIAAAISIVSLSIDTATAADRTQQSQAIKERISERRQDVQDVRGNVSATMTEIKESMPEPEEAATAVKEYVASFFDQFREGLVAGTLDRLDWMITVLFTGLAMALVGFFAMVLAVLSIERNTRRA